MTEAEKVQKEAEDTKKDNYERLLFAIAVLYANQLGIDIVKQDTYSKLSPAQKTFAKKIYEEVPNFSTQVSQGERLTEQQIVEDVAQVAQTKNNSNRARIVTVGDGRVCPSCAKWQDKVVSLDGSSKPTLDDAIADGFLHYGCRCALLELATAEIPLNPLNPRHQARRTANPAAYNSSLNGIKLVFNCNPKYKN